MKDIKLLGKEIIVNNCELLLDYNASKEKDFTKYFQVMAGLWQHDGHNLIGTELENRGGILYTLEEYNFDVMVTVELATCLPATRDLNVVWCSHWDKKNDDIGNSYVCGVNGWYDGLSGIERNGENSFYTSTSLYKYKRGKYITISCGSINGHCFMVVDDQLVTEIIDPRPLTSGYIGISPYCTKLKIKSIQVRKLSFIPRKQFYKPEF